MQFRPEPQDQYLKVHLAMTQFIHYLWLCIIISGLIANIINITIFIKIGLKDNVTITLFVLSLSDLAFLVFHLAATMAAIINRHFPNLIWTIHPMNVSLYPVLYQKLFYRYSGFVSAFLAVVRCMCVAKPLTFKSMFTVSRTFKILGVLFLLDLGLLLPLITSWQFVWAKDRRTNSSYLGFAFADHNKEASMIEDILNTKIISWVNFVLVAATTSVLAYKLKQASSFRHGQGHSGPRGAAQEKKLEKSHLDTNDDLPSKCPDQVTDKGEDKLSARDLHVIKSVTLVCVIYIVSYLPGLLFTTAQIIEPELHSSGSLRNLYNILFFINNVILLINANVNILVYISYNTKYRNIFTSFFCLGSSTT